MTAWQTWAWSRLHWQWAEAPREVVGGILRRVAVVDNGRRVPRPAGGSKPHFTSCQTKQEQEDANDPSQRNATNQKLRLLRSIELISSTRVIPIHCVHVSNSTSNINFEDQNPGSKPFLSNSS